MSSPYTEKLVRTKNQHGYYDIFRSPNPKRIEFVVYSHDTNESTPPAPAKNVADGLGVKATVKALRELVSPQTLADKPFGPDDSAPVTAVEQIENMSDREFTEWACRVFDLPREPLSAAEVQTYLGVSREASRALVEVLNDEDLRRVVRLHRAFKELADKDSKSRRQIIAESIEVILDNPEADASEAIFGAMRSQGR